MEEESPDLHIFDLNDDCLIEIVSFLPFKDVFKLFRIHSNFHNAIEANLFHQKVEVTDANIDKMENFFKKFGRKVKKVEVNVEESNEIRVKELIQSHGNAGNIESCALDQSFLIDESFVESNVNLFKSLKSFELHGERPDLDRRLIYRILDTTDRIEHLALGIHLSNDILDFLTKLQSLRLEQVCLDCPLALDEGEIGALPKVESVKKLSITVYPSGIPSVTCFPNIVDLRMKVFRGSNDFSLNELNDLRCLKKLKLSMSVVYMSRLCTMLDQLAVRNELEHLALYLDLVCDYDDGENNVHIVDILKRFTKLRSLHLKVPWTFPGNILDLIGPMTELQSLDINLDDFSWLDLYEAGRKISEICSSMKSLKKITFNRSHRYGDASITDDDYQKFYDEILVSMAEQENKAFLTIQVIDDLRSYYLYIKRTTLLVVDVMPSRVYRSILHDS